jgi:hypothetical protein
MKPINSKERTKQVWQFIFIFGALALVPVALIFFSYHKVPEKLSDIEQQKLANYSNFERSQKALVKHLAEIDSNLSMLANETSNEVPEVINTRVGKGLEELRETDTSKLMTMIASGYNNHLKHVNALIKARNELKNTGAGTKELQEQLQECKQTVQMLSLRGSTPMP